MPLKEKIYKLDGREFIIRSGEDTCAVEVSDGKMTLTVKPSTEMYGRGFRVYNGGSWKGGWNSPDQALDAACRELIALSEGRSAEELCKDLSTFYDKLS